MIYQLMASFLMIITLEMYHGYDKGDPSRERIFQVLQFKDIAVICLYISRFLSGCSAGKSVTYFLSFSCSIEKMISIIYTGTGSVATTIYLMDISPRTMRGEIITFHQLFIVIGILIGQIIGIPWFLGQHK